ncbi:MAG TPA: SusE domain-containing protein [Flavobacteriaceae bacterium]|nr:SusE domain-containing protein [Flavobacteriaceae bacterium]
MKKIKILLVMIVAILGFNSCEKDELVFTAQEPSDTFSFTNTFLDEYVLTPTTTSNIGERFTWNSVSFDTPTAVSYDLEGSITEDFSTISITKSTSGNDVAVTIGNLMSMATEAGLDNDPNTENPDTGTVYFRLKAYSGNDAIETISTVQALTLVLPEIVVNAGGISVSTWGVVGSGYNDWGSDTGGLDAPFYTTDTPGVIVSYVTLVDGEIKFRENNTWGGDLGDANLDGVLDADPNNNIPVIAGNYKITINTNDNSYSIDKFSWGIVGEYNAWGDSTDPNYKPDAKFYYDYTTDTFKIGVKLPNGVIKFRLNEAWTVNLGDNDADGSLEQDGANITVTEGYYVISLDVNNNTYTMEEGDVWGVVGSATENAWDGPDFRLTEVNPGIVVGDIITLTDGEIKFRINDAWTTNLGDDGNGSLVQDGANIPVTAGDYRVMINLNDNSYAVNKIQ